MSERILIADDDEDIRRLVAFTLRRRGYNVLEANAGDTALELIRAERPDLVVLDVEMPGLNGLEVASAMKADATCTTIPIIILSAKSQSAEIEQGLSMGAEKYLVKPFALKDLAATVAEILAHLGSRVEGGSHGNR